MELSDLTYFVVLLKNDLYTMHLHSTGDKFDTIHGITNDLYEEAAKEQDTLAELAISDSQEVKSFTNVADFAKKNDWTPIDENSYDWNKFVSTLNDIGGKFLKAIEDTNTINDSEQSYLDEIWLFWNKEVNFKNAARK